jgi:hypothetical protein
MRITEILLEYKRDVTAKNLGYQLLIALGNDNGNIPLDLQAWRNVVQGATLDKIQQIANDPAKSKIMPVMIDRTLIAIEDIDPTRNKEYSQWLARVYSKGGLKIEDMNRHNLLFYYNKAKRRGMIKPEHADINKFKSYKEFEDTIFPYNLAEKFREANEKKDVDKGTSNVVYNDANVRIVVPEDEAAACYYGRGTRWCTAGDKYNQFDNYNSSGKLYIMLPKSPTYPGEKYQLHFPDTQFMDPKDDPVSPMWLLTQRFPNTFEFFNKQEPEIQSSIWAASSEDIDNVWGKLKEYVKKQIELSIAEEERTNNDYKRYLKQNGYVDDHYNPIGSKNPPSFTDWNKKFGEWVNKLLTKIDSMSDDDVREMGIDSAGGLGDIKDFNEVMAGAIQRFEDQSKGFETETRKVITGISWGLYHMLDRLGIGKREGKWAVIPNVLYFNHKTGSFLYR